uniref:Uncharacterized protein n=1 Tax=Romanomermis culicivorax TaxID=13658 RepID=A0A915IBA3_ROMCU
MARANPLANLQEVQELLHKTLSQVDDDTGASVSLGIDFLARPDVQAILNIKQGYVETANEQQHLTVDAIAPPMGSKQQQMDDNIFSDAFAVDPTQPTTNSIAMSATVPPTTLQQEIQPPLMSAMSDSSLSVTFPAQMLMMEQMQ